MNVTLTEAQQRFLGKANAAGETTLHGSAMFQTAYRLEDKGVGKIFARYMRPGGDSYFKQMTADELAERKAADDKFFNRGTV